MSLTLHLSPDLEQRLREEAEQRGLTLEELLSRDLEACWGVPEGEPELLLAATQGLPESFWRRYRELIAKREAETLTEAEQRELIVLSDQAEELSVRRARALARLARLRGVEVLALKRQLGLLPVKLSA